MANSKLVIYPAVDNERLTAIQSAAGSMQVVNALDRPHALEAIATADVFFGKIDAELLSHAKQLVWVQSPTASLEHYLFPELVAHPCRLTNMRGLFSDVIADHVFAYILCFARNIPLYLRQQAQHRWEPLGGEQARTNNATGPGIISSIDRQHIHLADCTMGIVGVGQIGAEIARRGQAFGMQVIGVDPVRGALPGVIEEIWNPSRLSDLLQRSDFVVVAAPHTPETYKLFRYLQFEQMRRTAFFINIGRGVIVDLSDLTRALENKLIAGAALDVFEVEPLPADHALWSMENVIITPHIAAASPRIAERHTATLLENIRRFVRGEELCTLVDKERWF